jgi:hypothetical protein
MILHRIEEDELLSILWKAARPILQLLNSLKARVRRQKAE